MTVQYANIVLNIRWVITGSWLIGPDSSGDEVIVQNNGKKLEKLYKKKKFSHRNINRISNLTLWLLGIRVEIMIEKIVDWDMKLIDSNRIKLRNHRYWYESS